MDEYTTIPQGSQRCHLAWDHATRAAVRAALEVVTTYSHDIHESQQLMRCTACGQLYFSDWQERVSYGGGEDQQDEVLIPVADAAEALALSQQSKSAQIGRPALVMIFPPSDARPYWVNR